MVSESELKSIEEPIFEEISIYNIMTGPQLNPHLRISIFTPDEYEKFTNSWLYGCMRERYKKTVVYGGSGDKGRDVAGYYENETWDNYQCKRYSNSLSPSTIKLEVGKIIYYSYIGDYTVPIKHYFVSPKGLTNNSMDLLSDSQTLKKTMLQEWNDICSTRITSTKCINLTDELREYINSFNFTIFTYVDSDEMINNLYGTKFYARFFGGGFSKPRSDQALTPPEFVEESETNYIKCLLEAYGDHHNSKIDDLESLASNHPNEYGHFKKQRQYYYTAEALRKYSLESLPLQRPEAKTHFEKLKDEYFCVIKDVLDDDFNDGYECIKAVIKEVARVGCDNSILKHEVGAQDKKGLCHHLSNDGKVKWVNKDE